MPSRMMHQSEPPSGPRRRRVSHPSIHLPRSVYLPSMNTALPAASRLCLGAKNSSDAASARPPTRAAARSTRSEEHTSELQSHSDLVCRLLLEKKNKKKNKINNNYK